MFRTHHRRKPAGSSERRAAAATELAVCLPVLTLVVFGSIQACNLIYLKHGAVTAAYEGTLELAKRNATNASMTARAQQVLDARGIRNGADSHPARGNRRRRRGRRARRSPSR